MWTFPEKRFYTREYLEQCAKELEERKAKIKKLKQCPHCEGTGLINWSYVGPHDWKADALRLWCKRNEIRVAGDDTVDRKAAAWLLDKAPITLRNWALASKGPICHKCPNGR